MGDDSNFNENIRIGYDISSVITSTQQLAQINKDLTQSISQIQEAGTGAMAAIANATLDAVLSVRDLNSDLRQSIALYEQMAQAARDAAAAQGNTGGNAPGSSDVPGWTPYTGRVWKDDRSRLRTDTAYQQEFERRAQEQSAQEGYGGGGPPEWFDNWRGTGSTPPPPPPPSGYDPAAADKFNAYMRSYSYDPGAASNFNEFMSSGFAGARYDPGAADKFNNFMGSYSYDPAAAQDFNNLMRYIGYNGSPTVASTPAPINNEANYGSLMGNTTMDLYDLQGQRASDSASDAARLGRASNAKQMLEDEANLNKSISNANEERARAYRDAAEEGEKGFNLLNNGFTRHLVNIIGIIAALEVLKQTYAFLKDVANDVIQLDAAQSRLSFISGASGIDSRMNLLQQSTSAAQYGVDPQTSYNGAIIASQYGASPQAQKTAQQIQLVFGGDYANTVQEVSQTMNRSNGEFSDQARILDLLATLYKSANLSLEQYFDSIQAAIPLSHQLGMSVEDTAVVIAKSASQLEKSPEYTAGLFSKVLQRTNQPEIQQDLNRFGITGSSPQEYLKNTAEAISQFQSSGNVEAADKLAILISGGGGAQSRQDLINIGQALQNFDTIQKNSIDTTGKWGELFGSVGNTIGAHLKEMTTLSQNFINVWANTGVVATFFSFLDDQIVKFNAGMKVSTEASLGLTGLSSQSSANQESSIDRYIKETGGGSLAVMYGNKELQDNFMKQLQMPVGGQLLASEQIWGRNMEAGKSSVTPENVWKDINSFLAAYNDYTANGGGSASNGLYDSRKSDIADSRASRTPAYINPPDLGVFGGVRDLPQGMTVSDIQKNATRYEGVLSAQAKAAGVDYKPQTETFLLYDKTTDTFKSITTTGDALALAMKRAADATNKFAGFRELPEGMNFNALQSLVQTWTTRIAGYEKGTQDYEAPQSTAFWDAGTKSFRTITAPLQALQFAIEELTKQMQQITGVFNVPSGGEALVAFSSLQNGFVPSDRLAGMTGGASGGTTNPNLISSGARRGGGIPGLIDGDYGAAISGAHAVSGRYHTGTGTVGLSGQDAIDRLNAHGSNANSQKSSRDLLDMLNKPGIPGVTNPSDTRSMEMNMTINNRIMVTLDSRTIATQMQTQTYRSVTQQRRSSKGGTSSAILLG